MTHTPQDLLNVLQKQRDDARNAEAVALAELQAANRRIVEQAKELESLKAPKPKKASKPIRKAKPNGKEAHA